jgi:hypothetical protein
MPVSKYGGATLYHCHHHGGGGLEGGGVLEVITKLEVGQPAIWLLNTPMEEL